MKGSIFAFSGLGAQWAGMGQSLYQHEPVFRETLQQFDTLFAPSTTDSIIDLILDADQDQIDQSEKAHRLTFCYQAACVQLLASKGIKPQAVIAHSSGEVAAAWCAGILSDSDAVLLVNAHCRLIRAVNGQGAMLYAAVDPQQAQVLLTDFPQLTIAAFNSLQAVVFSGDAETVNALCTKLDHNKIFCRRPRTSLGFHSAILDPHLDTFEQELAELTPLTATCPYYSSLTGEAYQEPLYASYWRRHIRQPVLFARACSQLLQIEKPAAIVEIAPQSILSFDLHNNIKTATSTAAAETATIFTAASKEQDEHRQFTETIDQLKSQKSSDRRQTSSGRRKDDVQKGVRTVLKWLLNKEPHIDALTTWFDLGISSLQILQLAAELSEHFSTEIAVDLFFRYPLIADFSIEPHPQHQLEYQKTTEKLGQNEPIAIIGMAFHFPPDLTTMAELHDYLLGDATAVICAPTDRPWLAAEKAAFLQRDLWAFDAAYFNISEGEAKELDPQQRLLLEISVNALEDARIPASTVRGTDVGVYLGISTDDFKEFSFQQQSISPFSATGNMFNTASGRLSYFHDFHGPAVSIDTACSSSMVAVHQACQALRLGECSLALAGGVNLILSPRLFDAMRAIGALSPTAACHSFNNDANGYVRGEGCALLVLKPLSTAQANGDRIHAVIRGSAINQDGRSNGLTAPNGSAQQQLLQQALKQADLSVDDISFIETHGTGTPLGDPIEVSAIAGALRDRDPKLPKVALGALKSKLGHLEACAGVAGLIKAVVDIKYRSVSGIHGLTHPSQHIDWNNIPLTAAAAPTLLSTSRLIAGVSSFGYSGTNAHILIEEPPLRQPATRADETSDETTTTPCLFALSAKTPEVLQATAARYLQLIAAGQLSCHPGLSKALLLMRDQHPHRLAQVVTDPQQLLQKLTAIATGTESIRKVKGQTGKIAMLLPGQGTQYVAMGLELYRGYAAFRDAFDECAKLCQQRGFSIQPVVYPEADSSGDGGNGNGNGNQSSLIDTSPYAQLGYLCFARGAFELWSSWGINPDLLIGHSLGEYVAAALAQVMSLEETIDLIIKRGELTSALSTPGQMLTVFADRETIASLLQDYPDIDIAVINSPQQLVVAGSSSDIFNLSQLLGARQIEHKALAIHFASHSRFIEPALLPFYEFCSRINYQTPQIDVLSNLTGTVLSAEQNFSATYWRDHLRQTVDFARCLETARYIGVGTYIEIGPSSVLTSLLRQQVDPENLCLAQTTSRTKSGLTTIFEGLKHLYLHGVKINWQSVFSAFEHPAAEIPVTAFKPGQRYLPEGFSMKAPRHQPLKTSTESSINTDCLTDILTDIVHKITWRDPSEIDLKTNLFELGLDSLMLVQLKQQIASRFAVQIDMSQFYEELDTLEKIAAKLLPDISDPVPAAATRESNAPDSAAQRINTHSNDPIAVLMQQQITSMQTLFEQQLTTLKSLQGSSEKSAAKDLNAAYATRPAGAAFRSMRLVEDDLTIQQKEFIANFSQTYNSRTTRSKQQAAQYRTAQADWINSLGYKQTLKELVYPIVAQHSQGAHFTDIDGNDYIDIAMGYGVGFLGHRHPAVVEALQQQLQRGFQLGPQSQLAGEVAERVCQLTGVERVAFCNTGSEAVMVAIRLARAVSGRSKLVIFANSYHGTYDSVLATTIDETVVPAAAGILPAMVDDVIVLSYGDTHAIAQIESMADLIAAVLVEPVQSRKPDLVPVAFVKQLRELTLNNDIALIFDETITGFRMHPAGAQHLFGVTADIVIYGKSAGGGMPLSMVCGTARYLDAIDGGDWQFGDNSHPHDKVTFFGGTYVKHPLALAATKASLDFIADQGPALQQRVGQLLSTLAEHANRFFFDQQVPIKLVHYGSMFRFEGLGRYSLTMNPVEMDLFFYLLLQQGIYTWEKRICFLSVAHTHEDIEQIFEAIKHSVRQLRAGGFAFAFRHNSRISKNLNQQSYLLSSAQRRLLVFDQLSDCKTLYNLPLPFVLDQAPDQQQLADALDQMLSRHPLLTARFFITDDQPCQQIVPSRRVQLETGSIEDDNIDDVIDRFIRPFDLDADLLLRAGLYLLPDGRSLLLFDLHHIIADGLGLNIFLKEISQLLDGTHNNLPQPADYAEFVEGEQHYRSSTDYLHDKQFWLGQFQESVSALDLPGTKPRPQLQDYQGDNHFFQLSEQLTEQLKKTAASCHVSLFSVLLTGFAILLKRSIAASRLCIGVPVDTRPAEFNSAIGMFANTLALPLDLDLKLSFYKLVRQTQKKFLQAYEHHRYPLDDLIQQLELPRDLSRNPLFDVMFIFENGGDRGFSVAGKNTPVYPYNKQTAMFDLTLEVIDLGTQLQCRFEYARALFDAELVKQLHQRLIMLLETICSNMISPVTQIDLLTGQEKLRLHQLNATNAAFPDTSTLPQLWQQQVTADPAAVALICQGQEFSRRWLDETSDSIAVAIIDLVAPQPDDRIAIFMERSPFAIAGLLAIIKTGAAYVPVSMEFPPQRRDDVINDSAARALLVSRDRATESWVEACDLPVIIAEDVAEATPQPLPPCQQLRPDHLAYIMFTSGSTGKPKGVMISHRNLISFTSNLPRVFGITEKDTLLAVTTFTFDISVLEIFSSLLIGVKIVLATEDDNLEIAPLAELMHKHQVTAFQTTPSRLKLMLQMSGTAALPPGLRTLLIGGEAFPTDLFNQLKDHQIRTFNVYGPTETTIWSTCDLINGKTQPLIGTPLLNEQGYLLDSELQPVPPGTIGQLYIGGAGVGRGYVGRDDLTRTKFIPPPWNDRERIYATGDLARLLDSGLLEFLGRSDDQIKLRGYRIELQDIENCLATHDAIALAAVTTLCDGTTGEVTDLAAYYTLLPQSAPPSVDQLREHLGLKLPPYMIPGFYHCLDQMPLNTSGKINRKALPAISAPTQPSTSQPEQPLSITETTLLKIMAEVLARSEMGVDDSFFSCGGDSVRAILVVSRARKADIHLNVRDVFTQLTVRKLAALLENRTAERCSSSGGAGVLNEKKIPVPDYSIPQDHIFPLTTTQEGMLFHTLFDTTSHAYVNQARCTLTTEVDSADIAAVWQHLSERHAMLRTSIELGGETPAQRVHTSSKASFLALSLQCDDENSLQSQLVQIATDERKKISTFEQNPPVSLILVDCGDQRRELIWTFHHILFDGWSIGILLKEALAIYFTQDLPRKTADYSVFLTWLANHDDKDDNIYWRETLRDMPAAALLTQPQADQEACPTVSHFTVNRDISERLKTISADRGVTLNALFLAAWGVTVAAQTGADDLVLGTTFSGRPEELPGVEDIVGLFIKTLPLPVRLNSAQTLIDIARQIQLRILAATPHQQVNLAQLQQDAGRILFDHLIIFENYPLEDQLRNYFSEGASEADDTDNIQNISFYEQSHYPLEIMVMSLSNNTMDLRVAWDQSIIGTEQVKQLMHSLISWLQQLASDPDCPIDKRLSSQRNNLENVQPKQNRPSASTPPSIAASDADADDDSVSIVSTLFARVLDVPRIEPDANFFSLGGHSLKVVRLAGLIKQQLNHSIPLKTIYQHPTPRQLAAALKKAALKKATAAPTFELKSYPIALNYPLSEMQKGLWLHQQLAKDSVAYNTVGAFLLAGELQQQALEQAIQRTIDRHESLRTVYQLCKGEPRQMVLEKLPFTLAIENLQQLDNPEAAAREDILRRVQRPFHLDKAPLFDILVYRLDPERHILALIMHHIVSDGWSDALLAQDISFYYHQLVTGGHDELPQLPFSYRDFAQAQQHYISSAQGRADQKFWSESLSDVPEQPSLLVDFPRPAIRSGRGGRIPLHLSAHAQQIRYLAEQARITPFVVLQALLKLLIQAITREQDLVVGTPVANRQPESTQQIIGYFLNLLPLRTRVMPTQSFLSLLTRIGTETLDALEHQSYPFSRMVEDLCLPKTYNRHPLFDIMMIFHNNEPHLFQIDEVTCSAFFEDSVACRFDLDIEFFDSRNFDGFIEYDRELYRPETIEQIATSLAALAAACCATPTATVDDLSQICRNHFAMNQATLLDAINNVKDDF